MNGPKALSRLSEGGGQLLVIGYIRFEKRGICPEFFGNSGAVRFAQVQHRHAGPVGRQRPRRCFTQAGTAAGDDRHTLLNIHICPPL